LTPPLPLPSGGKRQRQKPEEKRHIKIKKLLNLKREDLKVMLVKIEEVAEMLSMNKSSIYKLIYHDDIPYTKIGGASFKFICLYFKFTDI
jgi:hypothetical protein